MEMETPEEILTTSRTVAVVGLSPDPEKASNRVARYLKKEGYTIIPVNPTVKEVLGQKSYPDLTSVPQPVDVVDIFRRSEDVPPIVEQAIALRAKTVWMQEGIINEEAATKARKAGLKVIMNQCMMKQHRKLTGAKDWERPFNPPYP